MEYPKNWENIIENWDDETPVDEGDIIIIRDGDGVSAHLVKGIDWVATIRANRRKIFAALGVLTTAAAAVLLLLRLLNKDSEE